ncbi:MarR family winged helix-turn-helix transcriptional regulator [Streptomyces sp. SP18CS02]|uniref:MarR family winged helix-turn-helix transcriptional regulator n=1 Tax=Streptomyces sp. SP18CS02 TaxID=3002531 RepID=UPI002E75E154|nr:MarR family winged helix-turn-helix transcriptional regulator [Streptomyces sp. SP18CS02]MEE1754838.1 MarR family winged helix-turn-helix transcriptional regulator [Streptomyces sp. SP18CS02]
MSPHRPEKGADPLCTDRLPSAARGGPVSHTISRVARLHRIVAGKFLRAAGIYPGQEFVMMYLWDQGPVRQSELIKAVDLDPSTVTKMLQRLEQSGHVRRSPDPADRRAVLVEATGSSCSLLDEVRDAWSGLEEHTLAGLGPAERAELARLLAKVEANLCKESYGCPDSGEDAQPESTSSVRSTSAAEL